MSSADAGQHEDEQHGQRERETHGGGCHERDIGEAVATEDRSRGPEQHGAENQDGGEELPCCTEENGASGFCGNTIR